MEIIKWRVVLDTEEEVFRDIEMETSGSLEQLHEAILAAYGLPNDQMASFYLSDQHWNKGDEYILMDMGEGEPLMSEAPLADHIHTMTHLLYVYDFLDLKIFYVELIGRSEPDAEKEYPYLVMALGSVPEKTDPFSLEGLRKGIQGSDDEDGDDYDPGSDEEEGDWDDTPDSMENLDDYEGLL